jgi:hypothetical protein
MNYSSQSIRAKSSDGLIVKVQSLLKTEDNNTYTSFTSDYTALLRSIWSEKERKKTTERV